MNFIIYKIVCNDLDVKYTYVGSTKDFTKRKCLHKSNSNNEKYGHKKLYSTMKANDGWGKLVYDQN